MATFATPLSTPTRVYTLDAEETRAWRLDVDEDGNAFHKRSLSTNERKGTRIEILSDDGQLLEAFQVS